MKKLLYTAAFALPLAIAAGNSDAFWHRDVQNDAAAPSAAEQVSDKAAQKMSKKELKKEMKHEKHQDKHHDKHDMKSMKKMMKNNPERWLAEETAEINEDYNKAVYKIGQTNLPEDAKDLLLSQAKSNKELALKQAKEKSEQMADNMEAREKFRDQFQQEKRNRKAIREVEDIL